MKCYIPTIMKLGQSMNQAAKQIPFLYSLQACSQLFTLKATTRENRKSSNFILSYHKRFELKITFKFFSV